MPVETSTVFAGDCYAWLQEATLQSKLFTLHYLLYTTQPGAVSDLIKVYEPTCIDEEPNYFPAFNREWLDLLTAAMSLQQVQGLDEKSDVKLEWYLYEGLLKWWYP